MSWACPRQARVALLQEWVLSAVCMICLGNSIEEIYMNCPTFAALNHRSAAKEPGPTAWGVTTVGCVQPFSKCLSRTRCVPGVF